MIISCVFLQLEFTINTVFAGRLNDPAKLAGVGLGTSLLNVACFCPLVGMNGAIETLVSVAFGAKNLKLCGIYLNRGRLINTTIFIPIAIILLFSKQFLTAFNQQPEVIQYAHEYVNICLLGIYLRTMFDMKKRFLNCMSITWVPMFAQVVATLFHILWCYLFAEVFDFGVQGLGVATLLSDLILVIVIESFSLMVPIVNDTRASLDKYALQGWMEYFHYGVPAAVSRCAALWAFELLMFLSGIMGVREQAALTISIQIFMQMYMVNLGIQEATVTLVGN